MRTAAYKVDVASDRRRRGNVPKAHSFRSLLCRFCRLPDILTATARFCRRLHFKETFQFLFAQVLYPINLHFLQKLLQNMIESFFTHTMLKNRRKQKNTAYIAGRKYSAINLCTLLFWKSGI